MESRDRRRDRASSQEDPQNKKTAEGWDSNARGGHEFQKLRDRHQFYNESAVQHRERHIFILLGKGAPEALQAANSPHGA